MENTVEFCDVKNNKMEIFILILVISLFALGLYLLFDVVGIKFKINQESINKNLFQR